MIIVDIISTHVIVLACTHSHVQLKQLRHYSSLTC